MKVIAEPSGACALAALLWFGAEDHGKVFVSGEAA